MAATTTYPLIADDQNLNTAVVRLLSERLLSESLTKLVIFPSFFSSTASTLNVRGSHFKNSCFQFLMSVAGQTTSARPILRCQLPESQHNSHLTLIQER